MRSLFRSNAPDDQSLLAPSQSRLQRPPVEAPDLLAAARAAKKHPGDLDLVRGLLEGATRLLPFEPRNEEELAREIESELNAITPIE